MPAKNINNINSFFWRLEHQGRQHHCSLVSLSKLYRLSSRVSRVSEKGAKFITGRKQRKTWYMGPYTGVDDNLTLYSLRVDSNTFTMGNPMPVSTLTLCQSRPKPSTLTLCRLDPLVSDFRKRVYLLSMKKMSYSSNVILETFIYVLQDILGRGGGWEGGGGNVCLSLWNIGTTGTDR